MANNVVIVVLLGQGKMKINTGDQIGNQCCDCCAPRPGQNEGYGLLEMDYETIRFVVGTRFFHTIYFTSLDISDIAFLPQNCILNSTQVQHLPLHYYIVGKI